MGDRESLQAVGILRIPSVVLSRLFDIQRRCKINSAQQLYVELDGFGV